MARILIVEDDKVLNQAYKMILEDEGHKVRTAFNGSEAISEAEEFDPQIILLDLLMPVMGGLEFLEKYDPVKKHPNVKVVILSNIGNEKEASKGMKLGAYKYIVKAHASPKDLCMLVKRLIDKNLDKKVS